MHFSADFAQKTSNKYINDVGTFSQRPFIPLKVGIKFAISCSSLNMQAAMGWQFPHPYKIARHLSHKVQGCASALGALLSHQANQKLVWLSTQNHGSAKR